MARAEVRGNVGALGHGQNTSRRKQAAVSYNRGAVVQRRIGEENVADKFVGYTRVNRGAVVYNIVKENVV